MKHHESITDLHGSSKHCSKRLETDFCKQIVTKFIVVLRPQLHNIAKAAKLAIGQMLWPKECVRRSTIHDVLFEIPVKLLVWCRQVPFKSFLLTIQVNEIDNTLSTSTQLLDDGHTTTIG